MKIKLKKQIQNLINKYYHFFDKKLNNSIITVGVISLFIFSVGISFGGQNNNLKLSSMKTNLIESDTKISYDVSINQDLLIKKSGIIDIGGKKYKIFLEEINKNIDSLKDINKLNF